VGISDDGGGDQAEGGGRTEAQVDRNAKNNDCRLSGRHKEKELESCNGSRERVWKKGERMG